MQVKQFKTSMFYACRTQNQWLLVPSIVPLSTFLCVHHIHADPKGKAFSDQLQKISHLCVGPFELFMQPALVHTIFVHDSELKEVTTG